MKSKFIITFLLAVLSVISSHAQTNKIKFGATSVIVKGKIFNEITYNFSSGKNKFVAYQFVDKVKKSLLISEVTYTFEGAKPIVSKIETYTCPLVKISQPNSYNLEMENDALPGLKYWRLTLVTDGTGADNLFFQKQTQLADGSKPETQSVNNVAINILNKISAAKWLKEFTK
jgi:hypothetical protein